MRSASATIGGIVAEVLYAGSSAQFPGVDQLNLVIRRFQGLSGLHKLRFRVDGVEANEVDLLFE